MNQQTADKIKQQSIGLRQLERGAGLCKLLAQEKLNRRLVRKTQDGTLGRETREVDEDDTHLQLGDNIYQLPDRAPNNSSSAGKLALIALAAALAGGTLVTAIGKLTPQSALAPPAPVSPADSNIYDIERWVP